MTSYPAEAVTQEFRYQTYGALSAALDSPYLDSAARQEHVGSCLEHGLLSSRFSIPKLSLDADVPGWGQRFLITSMFVPFAHQTIALTSQQPRNRWTLLAEELEQLSELPEDWDHEGSPPISNDVLVCVGGVLSALSAEASKEYPPPTIVPVPGGRVQLEWRCSDQYFEIEFLSTDQLSYLYKKGVSIKTGRIPALQVSTLAKTLRHMFS